MSEREAQAPFAARTVAILVIGGALLALAAMLLSGFGEDLSRIVGDRPGPDTRHGAGFAAFKRLATEVNGVSADAGGDTTLTTDLLILTPTIEARPDDVKAIVTAREAQAEAAIEEDQGDDGPPARFATLIILPKWQVATLPLQSGRVQRTGWLRNDRKAALVPAKVDIRFTVTRQTGPVAASGVAQYLRPFLVPEHLQAISGEQVSPLIGGTDGAVLARIGRGDTYVLADPDLVNNAAMAHPVNAVAAMAMLRAIDPEGGGRAVFDTTLHYRPGARNLVRLLFTPPFLGVTLAMIAAAVLAGIAAAQRFGPVARERRAVPLGKRALIDNITALTRLAGRTREAGGLYADAALDLVQRRLGGRREADRAAALARLDRMGGRQPYSDIDHRLRDAHSEHDLAAAARQFHDWRKEMGA